MGLNGRLHASATEPTTMYVNDFAQSGLVQQIITTSNGGASYPGLMRDELLNVIPRLRDRFPTYASYARARIEDLFPSPELSAGVGEHAYTFAAAVVGSNGDG